MQCIRRHRLHELATKKQTTFVLAADRYQPRQSIYLLYSRGIFPANKEWFSICQNYTTWIEQVYSNIWGFIVFYLEYATIYLPFLLGWVRKILIGHGQRVFCHRGCATIDSERKPIHGKWEFALLGWAASALQKSAPPYMRGRWTSFDNYFSTGWLKHDLQ